MKFFTTIALLIFSLSVHAEKYVFAVGEWAPFIGSTIPNNGSAAEILIAVLKENGDQAEFQYFPWARAEVLAATDKTFIGSFPWAKTPKRIKEFEFTELFMKTSEKLFYVKNKEKSIEWKDLSDLKVYKIGGTRSYSNVELLEKNGLTLDIADSDEQNFIKLLAGRIQYFPIAEPVGWDLLKSKFPYDADKFATVEKPILKMEYGIILRKNDPAAKKFIVKFNRSYNKLLKNGKIKEILSKYQQ